MHSVILFFFVGAALLWRVGVDADRAVACRAEAS